MPAIVTLEFDASAIPGLTRALLARVLPVAGARVAEQIRRDIAVPWPPASLAGRPPHRRTGKLHASIGFEVAQEPDGTVLRVGSGDPGVPYGRALELGHGRVAPRPYLAPNVPLLERAVADAFRAAAPASPP